MKKFFNKLIESRINPNQFYILYCIHTGEEAQFVNPFLDMRALRTMEYLDKTNKITQKGIALLKEMDGMMKAPEVKPAHQVSPEFLTAYYEMWPRIKLGSGKYARTDKKSLEVVFKWFFKTYEYSESTILQATAAYLNEYESQNWEYMRTSQYFVRKDDTSDLASYCAIIESGIDPNADNINHFPDKVV